MEEKSNKNMRIERGNFIAFEGIDGSGKTTQVQMLDARLRQEGIHCYTTMEPTCSPIGSLIRQILTGRIKTDNRAIAGLFVADRLDHLLNEVDGIMAKIDGGTTVITDRYYFSSYAYNSVDMPLEWVVKANEQSSLLLRPTVTIFIDVTPETAIERIVQNRFHRELFEKKSRLVKVRENYMKAFQLLEKEEKVVIIDGSQSPEKISEQIWEAVRGYFGL